MNATTEERAANDLGTGYTAALEGFAESLPELDPLYRQHYAEMSERLAASGVKASPYKPRFDRYEAASRGGWLLTYVLRHQGTAVGYSNVYLTNDMHNGDLIAQEDTIFVIKEHRRGVGRRLMVAIHGDLAARGVKRINVTTATDNRVATLLSRMGYKTMAIAMTLDLTAGE